ncbi:radical SAM protein [Niabella sp. W65]|nr:radical SAM protein [Niabella sp. W65]MCH7361796.1 radical SAM protein [Niabella sp. W65]ULT46305.1 radical SAM protein [Niabella sp. I65]
MGGCDVGCVWCDVKESWPVHGHPLMEINTIVETIKQSKTPLAVITGGEPLMHNLDELTAAIQKRELPPTLKHRVHRH